MGAPGRPDARAAALSRRALLRTGGVAALGAALPGAALAAEGAAPLPPSIAALAPMTEGVAPISLEEHRARLARAQRLLEREGLDALVVAAGSTLAYFTGVSWGLSERFLGVVLTREGDPAWVVPAFERDRALEQIAIGGDVRAWEEHESPYGVLAGLLADRKVASGTLGLDEAMPFSFADALGGAAAGARLKSGAPVVSGCRMLKDAHELAILRRACEITVQAHRAVFGALVEGTTQAEASRLSVLAHERLGIKGGALVLFGADAAYPHGTAHARPLRAGDMVLIDGGGELHGYESDITRTGVFSAPPTARQRQLWDAVRRAQDAAFRLARPGVECQALDAAARDVLQQAGLGAGYQALTHRLGHGLGMDGHERPYLVRGNRTLLQPGMCFSIEPGVYVRGETGVRHEDIVCVTEGAAENLTRWSGTPEAPAV